MHSRRQWILAGLAFGWVSPARAASPTAIRGTLQQPGGKPPVLNLEGRQVELAGDKDTLAVLNDKRLAGMTMELKGKFTAAGGFVVDPIHTRAIHVRKDGKNLLVTYWCDVCSIRTYAPGVCWCCQDETALDLRESIPGEPN